MLNPINYIQVKLKKDNVKDDDAKYDVKDCALL